MEPNRTRRSRQHDLGQRLGDAVMRELPAGGRFVLLYHGDGALQVMANTSQPNLPGLLRDLADWIEWNKPDAEVFTEGES